VIQRTDGEGGREHAGGMKPDIHSILLATALAVATSSVSAQTIYKSVDGHGHTRFADVPPVAVAVLSRRGATIESNEAARRLQRAQTDRRLGTEPRPGELNAGNGARAVNYRYWRRQERLRHVVEQAQRRSTETLRMQVAAR